MQMQHMHIPPRAATDGFHLWKCNEFEDLLPRKLLLPALFSLSARSLGCSWCEFRRVSYVPFQGTTWPRARLFLRGRSNLRQSGSLWGGGGSGGPSHAVSRLDASRICSRKSEMASSSRFERKKIFSL